MKTQILRTAFVAMAASSISLLPIASQPQQDDAANFRSPPGTYYSAQSLDSAKIPTMAPLPFNPFPELPVYSIGERMFIYDDRAVDYEAMRKEQADRAAAEGAAFGGASPEIAGAGGQPAGPRLNISNLGNGLLGFGITMAPANTVWDLYFVKIIVAQRWQWRRVYAGVPCDANGEATFTMQQPDPSQGFFVVLNAADDDGDGLGNGYEAWFKYNDVTTVTNRQDSDFDGMLDGWEVEYGLNPTSSVGNDGASGNPDSRF